MDNHTKIEKLPVIISTNELRNISFITGDNEVVSRGSKEI